MKKVYIYTKFERFWHWTQALLIILLAMTGFEIHGGLHLFGFKNAVFIHRNAAYTYLILLFLIFTWMLITGQWRTFWPKVLGIAEQVKFYTYGIFKGAEHPTTKSKFNKFNPLQRLTYFGLLYFIIPFMVITGVMYLLAPQYAQVHHGYALEPIAVLHLIGAFFLVGFVIGHVYLTTTGYKVFSSIKAMFTGWEEMSDEEAQIAIKELLVQQLKNVKAEVVDEKDKTATDVVEKVFKEAFEEYEITPQEFYEKMKQHNLGYFRLDKNGNYVEVNDTWKQIYSCTEYSDPVGMHHTLNRVGEARETVERFFREVMEHGRFLSGVKVTRFCTDGTTRCHTITAGPVYNEKGDIVGVEGFIIDLGSCEEEKLAEDKLKQLLLDSGIGYFRINKNGYYEEVNDIWKQIYQCTEIENPVGMHYTLNREGKEKENVEKIFDKVIKGKVITGAKVARICKDGTVRYHRISVKPIYKGKEIIGIEGYIIDEAEED